ncbi:zinc-dependent alcohol dehydrogenase [Paenibacillus eucommiae]|uniref:L-gulonate 5-dehydrogenase n=1 Tax=Paenibacillus eucommiae TaxID=1355755 RepID=A0ABS4IPD9_9BACL|nr:alcohol dehydrogenase catalytic domain-containing protein [Paenibacillus eucommiae]MBP1989436.1 L-gulonate 5-dehydrogenase [Paenibacillus eucommiae]
MSHSTQQIWEWTGLDKVESREVQRDEPGAGKVEVRIKAIGICGTDLHIMDGHFPFGSPPQPLGHELSGVVERVGKDVAGWVPGTRVCIDPLIGCGVCMECLSGSKHRCPEGVEIGLHIPGGWQQFLHVPADNLYRIADEVTFEEATQAETLHCCLGGIDKLDIRLGMHAAVIGDGPTGLYFLQLLKASGISKLTLIGRQESRLRLGKELGADVTIFADEAQKQRSEPGQMQKQELEEELQEQKLELEESCDIVIDAAGNEASIALAIRLLRKGGQLMLFGLPANPVPVDIQQIVLKELRLIGTTNAPDVWQRVVQLQADGGVRVKPLITQTFTFDQLDQAISLARNEPAETVKIIVTV